MNVDSINNGYVIDHIRAGTAMEIYKALDLCALSCPVAVITNVQSKKLGRKDIIKIDEAITLDLDVLGYIYPGITVNVVVNGEIIKKFHPELPGELTNIIRCKNPRCISSIEQELPQVFRLTDRENRVYRCVYCETRAKQEEE